MMAQNEPDPIVTTTGLGHDYGARRALREVDLVVPRGSIFGLLGPNGGGKTTLFRILATMMRPTRGSASVRGRDVVADPAGVRRAIGVVFQSPALDRKLTVRENLLLQARLHDLRGAARHDAVDAALHQVDLAGRAADRVQTLSGGLMRRVEIAKCLLHRPPVLLLDEPSSALDPGARNDLWTHLRRLRDRDGVTVLVTTHLMEEAERCDRIAILNQGALVACGPPRQLKDAIGGQVIVIRSSDPQALKDPLERLLGAQPQVFDDTLRLEAAAGHQAIPGVIEAFGDRIESITVGRPTLLDVFIHHTGQRFGEAADR